MRLFVFYFVILNLTNCFLIPRFQINQALKKKDCQKLKDVFLQDLSYEDLKKSFEICLDKNEFQSALEFLSQMQNQMDSLVFLEKRASLYLNLGQFKESIQDYKKILENQPQNKEIYRTLLDVYIERGDFKKSLEIVNTILDFKLSKKQNLEFEFIQARLLLLLYKKKESRQVFLSIQERDPSFFNSKQGGVYLALISEEERNFSSAIQELRKTKWRSFENKILHWQNREKNKPR